MHCRWLVAVVGAWSIVCCAPAAAAVRVVATIFPLTDMVRQVGRDVVEVVTLLPPGASPHTFEPTPAQMRDVAHAQMFVQVGAGLDNWANKLLSAGQSGLTVLTLTDGIPLLGAVEHGGESAHGDPHVWLDPVLVRDHLVPAIVAGLSRVMPEQRAAFAAAADEFCALLTRFDVEARAALATAPQRNYIAFHSAWRYFGARYDVRELATVESFPGKEPSAREIASVVDKARAAGVHAVLIEPQFSPRVAEQIAREFGGTVYTVDPTGGPEVPGRAHYIDLMRFNLQAFMAALR